MRSLRHVTPPLRVYCGADSLRQLASELDRIGGRRAVVFCGQTLARHPDGLRLVADALGDRYAGVFDGVKAHSPIPTVIAGAEKLRVLDADAAIAVGGGSAVVTARASSILLAVERLFAELALPRRLREIGVREESLTVIADDVSGDWFLHQNPRPVSGRAEILEVLRSAW